MSEGQKVAVEGKVKARSFRDLWVWQKGMALAKGIYGITRPFPREEKFGLVSQMRRAAVFSTHHSSLVTDFISRAGDQGVECGQKDDAQEKVGGKASHDDDGKGPLGIRADVVG